MIEYDEQGQDMELANEHVQWYMTRLREQWNAWMDLTEKLMADNFAHGVKHGRELEREKIKAEGG